MFSHGLRVGLWERLSARRRLRTEQPVTMRRGVRINPHTQTGIAGVFLVQTRHQVSRAHSVTCCPLTHVPLVLPRS